MNRDQVVSYIQDVHFGYLATVGTDGRPRVRPVAVHTILDDGLYFFTFGHTRKVAELAHNPQVEVVWSKLEEQSQVRIRGTAALETDETIKGQFIAQNPMVTRMLPPEAQHLFRLYRLEPSAVETAAGLVPYESATW